MKIVFTDLDGTLLDHETYSWEAARPGIEHLECCGVPWVLVTSKTRAEVELLRTQLGNRHPFIVENGAVAYVPRHYFSFPISGAAQRDGYHVMEWGKPYEYLVSCLNEASRQSRCRVRGFNEMTAAEISFTCDLPLEQAMLAKLREYDEPFRVLDIEQAGHLLKAIERQDLRWTKGGRFWHITGANDKAVAVKALRELFECAYGSVVAFGFGDAANDAPFLKAVDVPVLLPSPGSGELKMAMPDGVLTEKSGPGGWNEAILKMISA